MAEGLAAFGAQVIACDVAAEEAEQAVGTINAASISILVFTECRWSIRNSAAAKLDSSATRASAVNAPRQPKSTETPATAPPANTQ